MVKNEVLLKTDCIITESPITIFNKGSFSLFMLNPAPSNFNCYIKSISKHELVYVNTDIEIGEKIPMSKHEEKELTFQFIPYKLGSFTIKIEIAVENGDMITFT